MNKLKAGLTPTELLDECWRTLDQLQINQSQIFIDLGQTQPEREEIAELLANTLYKTGFMRVLKKQVQHQLDHDDVLMMVQSYLRQEKKERVLHKLEVIQAKKSRHPHERVPIQRERDDPQRHDPEASTDPVSEVSGVVSLRTRRDQYQRIGIRRDTRRTARCDDRPVPDTDVPA